MAITLKNPITGKRHDVDANAVTELELAITEAEKHGRGEVVIFAMTLPLSTAREVVRAYNLEQS